VREEEKGGAFEDGRDSLVAAYDADDTTIQLTGVAPKVFGECKIIF
jgi:hypothetical protein